MKKMNLMAFAASIVLSANALAGIAYSTYPISKDRKMISTELTGDMSDGGGAGMKARLVFRPKQIKGVVDAGVGVSGGERGLTFFAGHDYELYPDYKKQPKISVKSMLERIQGDESTVNRIKFGPTATKGFNFWGKEAYPYVSLPIGLALNSTDSSYEYTTDLTMGITGKLPIKGYSHLVANLEANVGVMNSYSGLSIGLSYPIN